MPKTPSSLPVLTKPLVGQFNLFCEQQGLVGLVEVDLLCIKCSDNEIYEARREDAFTVSDYMYESMVSDRRVSFFKMKEPIATNVGAIAYIELCDQKPDNSQDDRISHFTIVPLTISYEEVVAKLKQNGVDVIETIRPHYTSADSKLPSGFTIRLAKEFLVDKIKRDEMI